MACDLMLLISLGDRGGREGDEGGTRKDEGGGNDGIDNCERNHKLLT